MRSATKWMAAMLTICMVAGSGCGSSEPEALTKESVQASVNELAGTDDPAPAAEPAQDDSAGVAVDWEDDPAEVTWMMWNVGGTYAPEGVQKVEDAINEITMAKLMFT